MPSITPLHTSNNLSVSSQPQHPYIADSAKDSKSTKSPTQTASAVLDNKGSNYSKTNRRLLKKKMFSALGAMRYPNKSMRLCGSGCHHGAEELTIKKDGKGGMYAAGLTSCRNHKCAYCAPIVEQKHIQRIKYELIRGLKEGKKIAFITSTAGFYVKSDFKDRMKALSDAFYFSSTKLNQRFSNMRMRRIEDTVNLKTNQPHYHIHSLVIFDDLKETEKLEVEQSYLRRWKERVMKKDCVKACNSDAQRIVWIEDDNGLAEYIAKNLSYEVSSRMDKIGKKKDSVSWFEWFRNADVSEFDDKKRKLAYGMLSADYKTQTITFSKDWVKEDELEMEEEKKEDETVTVVNQHSGMAFIRFSYKGYDSNRLFDLMGKNINLEKDFQIICWGCDDYLQDNPNNMREAGVLMTCLLRDWVDIMENENRISQANLN